MDDLSFSLSSASGSSSTLTYTTIYRNAASAFINRKFQESYDTLKPLLEKTLYLEGKVSSAVFLKAWSLYLALIDSAGRSLNGLEFTSAWAEDTRGHLVGDITNGILLTRLSDSFSGNIPIELFNGYILLVTKYGDSMTVESAFQDTEMYLSTLSADVPDMAPQQLVQLRKLVDQFVFVLLPIKRDFEYAREFIMASPHYELTREEQLTKLDKLEEDYRQTDIRKQSMIQNNQAPITSLITSSSSEDESTNLSETEDAKSISPVSSHSNFVTPNVTNTSTNDDRHISNDAFSSHWARISSYWSSRLSSYSRSTSWPAIIFLLTLLVSLSVSRLRNQIKQLAASLWRRLIQTLSMGFTVSHI